MEHVQGILSLLPCTSTNFKIDKGKFWDELNF